MPDVIGIGAINYDFIFHCKKSNLKGNAPVESSNEKLDWDRSEIIERIKKLEPNNSPDRCEYQIGGSALLAVKSVHAVDPNIKTAYVGVLGEPDDFITHYGKISCIEDELGFIDDRNWLFDTSQNWPFKGVPVENRYIGLSAVKLNSKNVRDSIGIAPGASNMLLPYIQNKEKEINAGSFVEFLSSAKWIHVSSLADREQFAAIMEYVKQAKGKNRMLRVSIDPGSEYTGEHAMWFRQFAHIADYIFLSESEKEHITQSPDMPKDWKNANLFKYFSDGKDISKKILVIKHVNRHELIDIRDNVVYVYYHRKLIRYQIQNDTGAGDCFAGGFIAGMLTDKLLIHQPVPIELGARAAKARMITPSNKDFSTTISAETTEFFKKKEHDGTQNRKQRIHLFFAEYIVPYLGGLVSGVIVSMLVTLICKFLRF